MDFFRNSWPGWLLKLSLEKLATDSDYRRLHFRSRSCADVREVQNPGRKFRFRSSFQTAPNLASISIHRSPPNTGVAGRLRNLAIPLLRLSTN